MIPNEIHQDSTIPYALYYNANLHKFIVEIAKNTKEQAISCLFPLQTYFFRKKAMLLRTFYGLAATLFAASSEQVTQAAIAAATKYSY